MTTAPQRDVWEALLAWLLYCIRAHPYLKTEDLATVRRLTSLLKQAGREEWLLLERIVEHLPSSPAVQELRLRVLSLVATSGLIEGEELWAALRKIPEGRDDDLDSDNQSQFLQLAFELPGLPVAALRQTLRGALASAEVERARLASSGSDGIFRAVVSRLEALVQLMDSAAALPPPADDFPAAHSGDVEWFAVDAQGHVGAFLSWENHEVAPNWSGWWQPFRQALESEPEERRTAIFKPDRQGAGYLIEQLRALGLHSETVFDLEGALHLLNDQWYGINSINLHWDDFSVQEVRRKRLSRVRLIVPARPVTVDQLPSKLRAIVEQVRFEHVSFLDSPLIQPLEHFEGGWGCLFSDDGRTLRATFGERFDLAFEQQAYQAYRWLDVRIRSGELPEPRVLLSRPK